MHEEVLYLQALIPPKRFGIFSPLTGGCSESLGAFWFFFKNHNVLGKGQVNPLNSHSSVGSARVGPRDNLLCVYSTYSTGEQIKYVPRRCTDPPSTGRSVVVPKFCSFMIG